MPSRHIPSPPQESESLFTNVGVKRKERRAAQRPHGLAVRLSLEEAQEFCESPMFKGRLVVGYGTSLPTHHILYGDADVLAEAKAFLTDNGIWAMVKFRDFTNSLIYREQKAVADLLTRFKNIVSLAALPEGPDGESLEVAAGQSVQMEVETAAMISAAEDLLKLTREMKELWLFGPLRELGEGEEEGQMAGDAKKVGEKLDALFKIQNEKLGKDAKEVSSERAASAA